MDWDDVKWNAKVYGAAVGYVAFIVGAIWFFVWIYFHPITVVIR